MDDDELFRTLTEVKRANERVHVAYEGLRKEEEARDELVDKLLTSGRVNAEGIALFCGKPLSRASKRARRAMTEVLYDADSLNSSDIARMMGVSRAAVTNWKNRYDDFPRPDDTGLFKRDDVIQFLLRRGWLKDPVEPGEPTES